MQRFYSHLIEVESLIIELDKMDLTEEQKISLANLIDSSLHNTILDAILSEITEDDKRVFLGHLNKDEHDKIWEFLLERIDNIEDKIKKVAEDLKDQLHKDIRRAKKER